MTGTSCMDLFRISMYITVQREKVQFIFINIFKNESAFKKEKSSVCVSSIATVTFAGNVQNMKPVQFAQKLHRFHILYISCGCIPLKL